MGFAKTYCSKKLSVIKDINIDSKIILYLLYNRLSQLKFGGIQLDFKQNINSYFHEPDLLHYNLENIFLIQLTYTDSYPRITKEINYAY